MKISQFAKAIIGGAIAGGATAVATAVSDGELTREEILAAIGAALLAGLAVYRTPNSPAPTPEPEHGPTANLPDGPVT